MKKLIFLLSILLIFSVTASAATRTNFRNTAGDNSWFTDGNWDSGSPEGIYQSDFCKAFILSSGTDQVILNSGEVANTHLLRFVGGEMTANSAQINILDQIVLGNNGSTDVLTLNDTYVNYTGTSWMKIGTGGTGGSGTVTMNGTSSIIMSKRSDIGADDAAYFYMNDSAYWETGGTVILGNASAASGYLELNSSAHLNMTGGLYLEIGGPNGGSGQVQLNGGQINTPGIAVNNGHMQVDGGVAYGRDLTMTGSGTLDVTDGYVHLRYTEQYDDTGALVETWAEFKDRIQSTYFGQISQNNGTELATFFVDDTTETLVIAPEPATVAILGMGLVFFRRRK